MYKEEDKQEHKLASIYTINKSQERAIPGGESGAAKAKRLASQPALAAGSAPLC